MLVIFLINIVMLASLLFTVATVREKQSLSLVPSMLKKFRSVIVII